MGRSVSFYKYQGTGNDFVIIDQLTHQIDFSRAEIAFMCDRRMGIGADGLMLMRPYDGYDFDMVYFNSDGNQSTMCGNGGRCISQLYFKLKGKNSASFMAIDGIHQSHLMDDGWVSLQMNDVSEINLHSLGYFLDTGSPHLVIKQDDIDAINVKAKGAEIRYGHDYNEDGINVNFLQVQDDKIKVRTYERGVENETLSCGTGVTASAIVASKIGGNNSQQSYTIDVKAPGGDLKVKFKNEGKLYRDIWLIGPAVEVFQGEIYLPERH